MAKTKNNQPSESTCSGMLAEFDLSERLTPGKHRISDKYFIKKRGRPEARFGPLNFFRRLRVSQARREQRCYELLSANGVPCPKVFEVSEIRGKFGLLEFSKIVTELIPGTFDLRVISTEDYFEQLRTDPVWRQRVIKEVAHWVRQMHQHSLYPQKLHFGNVLATVDASVEVKVYFIDMTSNIQGRCLGCRHKRKKDIAYLYRDARQWCTLRERVLFMHELLGTRKLSAKDRAFIKRVVRYAEKKWGMKTSLGTPVGNHSFKARVRTN